MLRCGPSTNLVLFKWKSPGSDMTPPTNSDVGAMHIGLQVTDIDVAIAAIMRRDDVDVLDGPQTNADGPTAGLTYIFCRTPWGFQVELIEAPSRCRMRKKPTTVSTDQPQVRTPI